MSIKEGKLLYHLTTLDVLESIIEYGLLSREELNTRQISFVDTANHEILFGRDRLGLSNYIPFHFHIHTDYDTYVKNNHDKEFIYLCIHRNYARAKGFYILPVHPTSTEQPQLYKYDKGIDLIDWDTMELRQGETPNDRYRRQVRMAECLSPFSIPIYDFQSIIVKNEYTQQMVQQLLAYHGIKKPPYIDVKPNYF